MSRSSDRARVSRRCGRCRGDAVVVDLYVEADVFWLAQEAGEPVADSAGKDEELVQDRLHDGVVVAGDRVGDFVVVARSRCR